MSPLAPLLFGATSVLLERWNGLEPEKALELIAKYRCTYAVVIPTQLVKLVSAPDLERYDFAALRFVTNGGAKLAATVAVGIPLRRASASRLRFSAAVMRIDTVSSFVAVALQSKQSHSPSAQARKIGAESVRPGTGSKTGALKPRGPATVSNSRGGIHRKALWHLQ